MKYNQALEIIHRTDWKGSVLGLCRIKELLHALGDPQKALKVIHVAGTNGKGSVSSFLCSVLTEAGYRVGLYTSPYLVEFRERIRIGETLISETDVCRGTERLLPILEKMEDSPTEFEVMTALAFWYFQKENCDYLVCEVGLGGEFDATNVIETPLLSVITTIGPDHTAILGDTIEQIASAKAGILKEGCPALYGEGNDNPRALKVIRARAEKLHAPLRLSDRSQLFLIDAKLCGTRFSYRGKEHEISLCGAYQPSNAAIAVDAVEILRESGLSIPEEALEAGLKKACWIGRFEVLSEKDPVIVIDGAHNPDGIRALKSSLDLYFPQNTRFCAVMAVMADKDYRGMLSSLSGMLETVFAVSPKNTPRALDAKKLAAVCGEFKIPAFACAFSEKGVELAIDAARKKGLPVLIFGSLYLYREAHEAVSRALSVGGR